jgi:adenylate kinase
MLNLILFGPPGSGKGTQSERLIEQYKLIHISTGDILRLEINHRTILGMEAKRFIDKGELVPDKIVIEMIGSIIEKNKESKGFIFDGFPRTTVQAIALDELMKGKNLSIDMLFALDVEHEILIERIIGRSLKSNRSDDRDVSVIENRIKVYHEQTSPLVNYYSKQNKYQLIVGKGSVEEIFSKICLVIDLILSGKYIKGN